MGKLIKIKDLGKELNKVIDNYEKEIVCSYNEALKVVYKNLFTNIIKYTPIDTGKAKSNWFINSKKISRSTEVINLNLDNRLNYINKNNLSNKKTYIINNLPYINALEYGFKNFVNKNGVVRNQAPNYMVRRSVKGFHAMLSNEFFKILKTKGL